MRTDELCVWSTWLRFVASTTLLHDTDKVSQPVISLFLTEAESCAGKIQYYCIYDYVYVYVLIRMHV